MRVALLIDEGFQDAEVLVPYYRLQEAGLDVDLVGRAAGVPVRGKYGYTLTTDAAAGGTAARDYGLVVVPGGYAPGKMRTHAPFVDLVRAAVGAGVPLAAICHGPQLLIEAGVVRGRTMTSYEGVRTDLQNAGAKWADREVVVDAGQGDQGPMVTSRKPDDLPAFCAAVLDLLHVTAGAAA